MPLLISQTGALGVWVTAATLAVGGHAPTLVHTASPGTGSVSTAGIAPGLGPTIAVPKGSGTFAGTAPVVSVHLSPGKGVAIISGKTPGLTHAVTTTTGTGTFEGYEPSTGGTTTKAPGVRAAVLAGQQPTVSRPGQIGGPGLLFALNLQSSPPSERYPLTRSAVLAGYAPSIEETSAITTLGSDDLLAENAIVAGDGYRVTFGSFTPEPATGSASFTGQPPVVLYTINLRTTAAVLSGKVPGLALALSLPDAGAMVLSGKQPERSIPGVIDVETGSAVLDGKLVVPYEQPGIIGVMVGAGTFSGLAPAPGRGIQPSAGSLVSAGTAPVLDAEFVFGIGTLSSRRATVSASGARRLASASGVLTSPVATTTSTTKKVFGGSGTLVSGVGSINRAAYHVDDPISARNATVSGVGLAYETTGIIGEIHITITTKLVDVEITHKAIDAEITHKQVIIGLQ